MQQLIFTKKGKYLVETPNLPEFIVSPIVTIECTLFALYLLSINIFKPFVSSYLT